MYRPQAIVSGRIGVFAPSSPFSDERFQRGVDRLRGLGFEVVLHKQLEERNGYLAGSDRARLEAFHDLVRDDSIGAIIAARGGYGAHRIIEAIDFDLVARKKKPLIGFSDVCAFHHAILRRVGLEGIHGPVVTQLGELPDEDVAALVAVLAGNYHDTVISAAKPSFGTGRAEGILTGGCLSVIAPMIGSDLLYLPEGSVLFLEDVGEAPYRIDRLLTHLRLAGVFKKVAAVALGELVGCNPPREHEQTIDQVLEDRLGDLGVPVVNGLPIGHGKVNRAIPLGAIAVVDAEARTLVLKER